jgi:small subunit ribosomal protein S6
MREYELMYITKPDLEADRQQALQDRVTSIISEREGEVTGLDVWGKRRLGYPIKHNTEGYYVVVNFRGGEDIVRELNRVLNITDEFLRFKILRMDHVR